MVRASSIGGWWRCSAWALCALAAGWQAGVGRAAAQEEQARKPAVDTEELDRLTKWYFLAPERETRLRLGVQISELVGGDVKPVAEALERAQLWAPQPAGVTEFDLERASGQSTALAVRVPRGYDPQQRYPLILGLHGMNGRGEQVLRYLEHCLGEAIDEYLVAAPTDYRGTWFNIDPEEAGDPSALLRAMRRRYHVDTERVYVFGYSAGGHGAFLLATLLTDEFAAAVSLAGTLVVPVRDQAMPLLLPNLANLPLLAVWGEQDVGDDRRAVTPGGGIAGSNRQIRRLATGLNLPLEAVELAGVGHRNVEPPIDRLRTFLAMKRHPAPRQVGHWFRFPAQGRISWLRQRRFGGQPWAGDQISIMSRPGADLDEQITEFLTRRLAYVGGRIEGQRIEVEVRRTAELEILLNDRLIDLEQPITVTAGGKIRYEGTVEPRVTTMLEIAHRDWDLQRLYSVRLLMRARSKAWQD